MANPIKLSHRIHKLPVSLKPRARLYAALTSLPPSALLRQVINNVKSKKHIQYESIADVIELITTCSEQIVMK